MTPEPRNEPETPRSEFEELDDGKQLTLMQEFCLFIKENKKWWLIPIVLVLALVSFLVALGATGAAPWIYTVW